MAKEYWLKFGTGNPSGSAGLAPTFIVFKSWTGGAVTAPGITQQIASYGLYRFEFTPSFPIIFVADGATTGLTDATRYLTGTLDPLDLVDERLAEVGSTLIAVGNTLSFGVSTINQNVSNLGTTVIYGQNYIGLTVLPSQGQTLVGVGNTLVAIGSTNSANITDVLGRIGTTASSFGTTSVDPGTVYGYLKRLQEDQEGNASFNKVTGAWQIKTRGGTLLIEKTLDNSTSAVTKT